MRTAVDRSGLRSLLSHHASFGARLGAFGKAIFQANDLSTQVSCVAKGNRALEVLACRRDAAAGKNVMDGRKASAQWNEELKQAAEKLATQLGRKPSLSVVVVGNRPDSQLYVEKKEAVCHQVGVTAEVHRVPESVTQNELESIVKVICRDPLVDGVLVQLPLPFHLDEEAIMEAFDPWKDVDGFHALNMGHMLMRGRTPRFIPCTALGCMKLLQHHEVDLRNKTAVVLGDSNIVGTPLSVLLRNQGAAIVTVCHGTSYKKIFENKGTFEKCRAAADACNPVLPGPVGRWSVEHALKGLPGTMRCEPVGPEALDEVPEDFHVAHLSSITQTADILIVAVGHPELVRGDWVKPGAVVLDVGINVTSECNPQSGVYGGLHVVGDVSFSDVSRVASAVTPVPGGVGPMTISGVMHNTILAARYGLMRHTQE